MVSLVPGLGSRKFATQVVYLSLASLGLVAATCTFTLCGALGSHGHCLAVAPCSGPLGSPSGSEGEPWGDSWPWCLGPGDSAALAHVGGNRRGVDLF